MKPRTQPNHHKLLHDYLTAMVGTICRARRGLIHGRHHRAYAQDALRGLTAIRRARAQQSQSEFWEIMPIMIVVFFCTCFLVILPDIPDSEF